MAKVEAISFSQFFSENYNSTISFKETLVTHFEKHKIAYRIIGTTIIIFASGILDQNVLAATGIDAGGNRIYSKLVNIGKWVIIFKGGFDTIQNTLKGDMDMARKSFLQYLMIYVILLALPWSMRQVDTVFTDL